MSKIELPPLPRPIYAASCGKDPFYTADHIRADRRQIVELCEYICILQARKSQAVDGSAFYIATGQCAAAIRSLLDPASPSSLPAEQQKGGA